MGSLIGLIRAEGHRIDQIIGIHSGPKVDNARNTLFATWLRETKSSRLFMVDTDMVLPQDSLSRLVSHNKDIVGGLAFTGGASPVVRPVIHVIKENEEGQPYFDILWDYPPDSLIEVDGIGAASMLVTRRCAEAIWEARGKDHPMPWFAFGLHNGVQIGEDIGFCLTAKKVGFKTYIDTGLIAGHHKFKILGPDDYVRSLMHSSHPHYTKRGDVPIYRDLTNDPGLSDDRQDLEGFSGF